jgi:catechol 2,3-dioxygenase-like lactoylglutathione lyase family enzyme
LAIRKFFHLIHVVGDLTAADELYDRLFEPARFVTHSWGELERRWASLFLIGDFVMETIQPSMLPEHLDAPLSRFYARFGEHFHSLAWYFDPDDPVPTFRRLRDRGIRVAKSGGGFYVDESEVGPTLFTHPRDTHGQLELHARDADLPGNDPRFEPGWSPAFWRDDHPLGIEGPSHITTVVEDLPRARALYEEILEGQVIHEETDAEAARTFVVVGEDTVVELARPLRDDTALGRDLAAHGELPHAMTWKVRDLDAAERHVEKVGVGISGRWGDTLTLDPVDTFGAILAFTDRSIPGDPR